MAQPGPTLLLIVTVMMLSGPSLNFSGHDNTKSAAKAEIKSKTIGCLILELFNNDDNNNHNDCIERHNLRFLQSPHCATNTYAQVAQAQSCANHVQHQMTRNTPSAYHMQHAVYQVVGRDSQAVKFDRVYIPFLA